MLGDHDSGAIGDCDLRRGSHFHSECDPRRIGHGKRNQQSVRNQLRHRLFGQFRKWQPGGIDGGCGGGIDVHGLEWGLHRDRHVLSDDERGAISDCDFRFDYLSSYRDLERFRHGNRGQHSGRDQLRNHLFWIVQRHCDTDGDTRCGVDVHGMERRLHWDEHVLGDDERAAIGDCDLRFDYVSPYRDLELSLIHI